MLNRILYNLQSPGKQQQQPTRKRKSLAILFVLENDSHDKEMYGKWHICEVLIWIQFILHMIVCTLAYTFFVMHKLEYIMIQIILIILVIEIL